LPLFSIYVRGEDERRRRHEKIFAGRLRVEEAKVIVIKNLSLRHIAGVLLIAISLMAFVFWESAGRELVTMDEVLVAKSDIGEGGVLSADMFKTVRVPRGATVSAAVRPANADGIEGKVTEQPIFKGMQLSSKQFVEKRGDDGPALSLFVIRSEWIYMCSSSLRGGDRIRLVTKDGETDFGEFSVAYVKDIDGKEVKSVGESALSSEDTPTRTAASNPDHLEILCDFETYLDIRERAEIDPSPVLVVIGKETPN
jgi:hypothetical protein